MRNLYHFLIIIASIFFIATTNFKDLSSDRCNNYTEFTNYQEKDSLFFYWAMIGATPVKQKWNIFSITRDTVLKTGDNLFFFFEPMTPCYIYLFLLDSDSILHLLFPDSVSKFGIPLTEKKQYYIPHGSWELDEKTGDETFYILVSTSQLINIEDSYKKNPISVINEIRNILKSNISDIAEVPEKLAGSFRSIDGDLKKTLSSINLDKYKVKIKRDSLYAKKIVIKHK